MSKKNHLTHVDFNKMPINGNFDINIVEAHSNFDEYSMLGFNTNVKHDLSHSPYN